MCDSAGARRCTAGSSKADSRSHSRRTNENRLSGRVFGNNPATNHHAVIWSPFATADVVYSDYANEFWNRPNAQRCLFVAQRRCRAARTDFASYRVQQRDRRLAAVSRRPAGACRNSFLLSLLRLRQCRTNHIRHQLVVHLERLTCRRNVFVAAGIGMVINE